MWPMGLSRPPTACQESGRTVRYPPGVIAMRLLFVALVSLVLVAPCAAAERHPLKTILGKLKTVCRSCR